MGTENDLLATSRKNHKKKRRAVQRDEMKSKKKKKFSSAGIQSLVAPGKEQLKKKRIKDCSIFLVSS